MEHIQAFINITIIINYYNSSLLYNHRNAIIANSIITSKQVARLTTNIQRLTIVNLKDKDLLITTKHRVTEHVQVSVNITIIINYYNSSLLHNHRNAITANNIITSKQVAKLTTNI